MRHLDFILRLSAIQSGTVVRFGGSKGPYTPDRRQSIILGVIRVKGEKNGYMEKVTNRDEPYSIHIERRDDGDRLVPCGDELELGGREAGD